MAYPLPLSTAWPGLVPEEELGPGQNHYGVHPDEIIAEQHWALAYQGRGHVGQRFGDTEDRAISTSVGSYTLVATYLIWQGQHDVGIEIGVITTSDGGADVRILAVEATTQVDFSLAAGANVIGSASLAFARWDLVTTIEVYLQVKAVGGGTSAELHDISIAASDLAVGDLP